MHKIVSLQAENVKRLKAIHIEPNGNVVVLSGKNEQGKSSALDAIWMAVGGAKAIPQRAVRKGTKRAIVVLELDGDSKLTVQRTVEKDGKTELRVVDGDGVKLKSPQKILDQLVGKITFDPLEFTRMRPADRITSLQDVAGVDLSKVDGKIAALLDSRRDVGRDLKQAQAAIEEMTTHEDAPKEAPSVGKLMEDLNVAHALRSQIDDHTRRIRELQEMRERVTEQLVDIDDEVTEKMKALENDKKSVVGDATVEALEEQIANAEKESLKFRENQQHETATAHAADLDAEWDDQSEQIEELREKRKKMMSDAKWPIEGMGFVDGDIAVHEIPFSDCSSAQRLKVSLLMAIKTNPDLRVCFIRDGSLLDEDSLKAITAIANEHDFQVWIERVAADVESAVVLEDGEIVSK